MGLAPKMHRLLCRWSMLALATFVVICMAIGHRSQGSGDHRDIINALCPKLWQEYNVHLGNARLLYDRVTKESSDEAIAGRLGSCSNFSQSHRNLDGPVPRPNVSVPLAFSILFHRDLAVLSTQLDMLVRARHAFCIHVDAKVESIIRDSVEKMANCYRQAFPGVTILVPKQSLPVYWGHSSILESDLLCKRLLWESNHNWHYVLSIAGTELPNYPVEVIEAKLADAGNQSVVESIRDEAEVNKRITRVWDLQFMSESNKSLEEPKMIPTDVVKSPVPHDLQIFKGSRNVMLNREDANFILNHRVSKELLAWMRNTLIPDETFHATLIRVKVLNNGNVSQDLQVQDKSSTICQRYSRWKSDGDQCFGEFIHEVCNYSLQDLPNIVKANHDCFVVNKFKTSLDSVATKCWQSFIAHPPPTQDGHSGRSSV